MPENAQHTNNLSAGAAAILGSSATAAEPIRNKVAESGLVTLDLAELRTRLADSHGIAQVDLAPVLFQGLILREKDLRAFCTTHNWAQYQGMNVAVACSADAIVPTWAFMLVAVHLAPFTKRVAYGDAAALDEALFAEAVATHDFSALNGARIVVKGCADGDTAIPGSAYVAVASALVKAGARSIMYGEPCSTVPLYKRTAARNETT